MPYLSIAFPAFLDVLIGLRFLAAALLLPLRLKGRTLHLSLLLVLLLPFFGYTVAVVRNSAGAWFERTRSGIRALLLSIFLYILLLAEATAVGVFTFFFAFSFEVDIIHVFSTVNYYVFLLFISLLSYPALILAAYILGSERSKNPWWIGRESDPFKTVSLTSGAIVLMLVLAIAFSWITYRFLPVPVEDYEPVPTRSFSLILMLISASVLAPVGEEIYFRGLIFEELGRLWGHLASAFVTSLFFSAAHGNLVGFPLLFLLGLILAGLKSSTRWILPPMVAHSAYNTSVILLAYFGF